MTKYIERRGIVQPDRTLKLIEDLSDLQFTWAIYLTAALSPLSVTTLKHLPTSAEAKIHKNTPGALLRHKLESSWDKMLAAWKKIDGIAERLNAAEFQAAHEGWMSYINPLFQNALYGDGELEKLITVSLQFDPDMMLIELRKGVNRGGRSRDVVLDALYRVAYPLFNKYRHSSQKWADISEALTELLINRKNSGANLSEDEKILLKSWVSKDRNKKRKKIETAFKDVNGSIWI